MGNTLNPRAIPSSCRNRPCTGPQRWQMIDVCSQQYLSFFILKHPERSEGQDGYIFDSGGLESFYEANQDMHMTPSTNTVDLSLF